MNIKETILKLAEEKEKIRTSDVVLVLKDKYSRGYVSSIINSLVKEGKLIKGGKTAGSFYVLPERKALINSEIIYKKKFKKEGLEEHLVLDEIRQTGIYINLRDNVKSIFNYAFAEMLNNAIDHSESKSVLIKVHVVDGNINFIVEDHGVGVFRNIKQKRKLKSELEAVQDLLKGKMTTQPKMHSGQGIFFTSKVSDSFFLESFGFKLLFDNKIKDIFFGEGGEDNKGTKVFFSISLNTKKHLIDIFKKYQSDNETMDFDKTDVKIKLYTMGTIYVSRSQARRVLLDLDKFKKITLDFEKVPMIGQGFADEIFRVYKKKNPSIKMKPINMNEAVKFMIERVE